MLYETIKKLAKSRKVSIFKIEKDLDFSNGSISKWNNSKPSAEKIKKVADYFKEPIETFFE